MRTYGQYCPIARTSELLAERWTIIILRNVLVGCQTFNEIADGAPGLSRGLLSRRLRELERAGIIQIRPKPDGHGSTYEPTQAGRELSALMLALERWGRKWVELKPEHAHPGVVLWVWANFFLDRDRLPPRRVVVRFECPTLPGSARRSWLLIERGDAEYCLKARGGRALRPRHLVPVRLERLRDPPAVAVGDGVRLQRTVGVQPLLTGPEGSMRRHWRRALPRGQRRRVHLDLGPHERRVQAHRRRYYRAHNLPGQEVDVL